MQRLGRDEFGLGIKRTLANRVACTARPGMSGHHIWTAARSVERQLMRRRQAVYYAFDLLWLDGEDLRQLPLVERKRRLRRLIRGHAGLLFAEQMQGSGIELFAAICARDLEGIVAKA